MPPTFCATGAPPARRGSERARNRERRKHQHHPQSKQQTEEEREAISGIGSGEKANDESGHSKPGNQQSDSQPAGIWAAASRDP